MSIFHINIQCLTNKYDELSFYVNNNLFDIVCLSEHWCKQGILNLIHIENFKLATSFNRINHIHGGVCIYLKENILYKVVDVTAYCRELDAEFCALEIKGTDINVLIVAVYRSNTGCKDTFLQLFDLMLYNISRKCDMICIFGDFNINFLLPSKSLDDLLNICHMYGIEATIKDFTRIHKSSATCIDNILTNIDDNTFKVSVVNPGISDHFGQCMNLTIDMKTHLDSVKKVRPITKKGLANFKESFANLNWFQFYNSACAENMASYLTEKSNALVQKHFPQKHIRKQKNIKWFNENLVEQRKVISAMKTICYVTKDEELLKLYKEFQINYNFNLKVAKRDAVSNLIQNSTNKVKTTWHIVNSERNLIVKNESLHQFTSNQYNAYFSSVVDQIVNSLQIDTTVQSQIIQNIPVVSESFVMLPLLQQEVFDAIQELKNTKTCDFYELSAPLIKELLDYMVEPLTILFNKCVDEGIFPDSLKISRVTPLFKKGDTELIENYRPISQVPIFAKIFEIILKKRLLQYFLKKIC